MTQKWIINEKVQVSKEWDDTTFTPAYSRQVELGSLNELLEKIAPKGVGIILYDGKGPVLLTLVDPREDVAR